MTAAGPRYPQTIVQLLPDLIAPFSLVPLQQCMHYISYTFKRSLSLKLLAAADQFLVLHLHIRLTDAELDTLLNHSLLQHT